MNAWLAENDLDATVISPGGDWLAIQVPVSKANEMLDADFSTFTHDASGVQSVRVLQYSIPEDLVDHLQLVHPTISFTPPISPKLPLHAELTDTSAKEKRQSACSSFVDPACLQQLYGIPTTKAANADPLVVTGYVEQYPNPTDMRVGFFMLLMMPTANTKIWQNFLGRFRPDINPSTTWTLVELDGSMYNPYKPGLEAVRPTRHVRVVELTLDPQNLDLQYTVGLATGVPAYFISVGPNSYDGTGGFLDTAIYVLSNLSDAYVMTTSYNVNEGYISPYVYRCVALHGMISLQSLN